MADTAWNGFAGAGRYQGFAFFDAADRYIRNETRPGIAKHLGRFGLYRHLYDPLAKRLFLAA